MQISDFHFDANYSTSGDPAKMCHAKATVRANRVVVDRSLGVYGDYLCDSPLVSWFLGCFVCLDRLEVSVLVDF